MPTALPSRTRAPSGLARVVAFVTLLVLAPGARAQVVESLVAAGLCAGGAALCLSPAVNPSLTPFVAVGIPFEQRRGGLGGSIGLFHHAPLGVVVDLDMLINGTG